RAGSLANVRIRLFPYHLPPRRRLLPNLPPSAETNCASRHATNRRWWKRCARLANEHAVASSKIPHQIAHPSNAVSDTSVTPRSRHSLRDLSVRQSGPRAIFPFFPTLPLDKRPRFTDNLHADKHDKHD